MTSKKLDLLIDKRFDDTVNKKEPSVNLTVLSLIIFMIKWKKSEVLYDLYEKSRPERFAFNYENY